VDSGTVSVNGGSLTVTNEVEVGAYGKGTLTITNRGNVTAGLLTIAALVQGSVSSFGTVTVDGSTFTINTRADVGGDNGTAGGIGLMTVTNGGTVSASNLHVYSSGTLTGNGTVSTTSGATIDGTIAPSGRLTIGGNLMFAGTGAAMQSKVVPASADNVYVSAGTASLNGRLSVTMTGDFRSVNTPFTLLYAQGGIVPNTTFRSVSITYPTDQGWSPRITYDANHVYLQIVFNQ
jgi:T5SS/PEP-CTERM-associated repeat protein